jgi:hypothetical protein
VGGASRGEALQTLTHPQGRIVNCGLWTVDCGLWEARPAAKLLHKNPKNNPEKHRWMSSTTSSYK